MKQHLTKYLWLLWTGVYIPSEGMSQMSVQNGAVSRGDSIEVVVHRGANHVAPENTLAATDKAVALGVDYVEVDVRQSRDGIHYILHDATLDRTTNGRGPIRERSARYIDRLDAGRSHSCPPNLPGQYYRV